MRKLLAILTACLVISLILAGCMVETPPLTFTPPKEEQSTAESAPALTEEEGGAPEPAATDVPTKGELKVHFIDVGQGDSILVDLGETEILIDGGDKSPGVVEYLSDYVDGAIEAMVATHPHADHIGGLITVLDIFQVEEIWLNGDTSTSETYSQFMSAVNSEGAQVYEARRGDTIQVGQLVFDVLHPVNLNDTTNNSSIVLSLGYGEYGFLFMGDAEKEAEFNMVNTGIVPDVEVLKVGHHGSSSSSSAQFLDAVNPVIAIYMAGEGNSYGHPHQETIDALKEVAAIYGTDKYGTLIVTTDGHTLSPPIIPPPEEITTPPPTQPEETTPPEESQVIEDLAYIKAFAFGYSDDADPESDGISLRITFYDTKSEYIFFQNIPVKVTIELYGYRDMWDFFGNENEELVYKEQVTIDPSDETIRWPFEDIGVNQNKYYDTGIMEVTVTTPEQGKFRDTVGFVRLYDEN